MKTPLRYAGPSGAVLDKRIDRINMINRNEAKPRKQPGEVAFSV
jgi:hypothetical protein